MIDLVLGLSCLATAEFLGPYGHPGIVCSGADPAPVEFVLVREYSGEEAVHSYWRTCQPWKAPPDPAPFWVQPWDCSEELAPPIHGDPRGWPRVVCRVLDFGWELGHGHLVDDHLFANWPDPVGGLWVTFDADRVLRVEGVANWPDVFVATEAAGPFVLAGEVDDDCRFEDGDPGPGAARFYQAFP